MYTYTHTGSEDGADRVSWWDVTLSGQAAGDEAWRGQQAGAERLCEANRSRIEVAEQGLLERKHAERVAKEEEERAALREKMLADQEKARQAAAKRAAQLKADLLRATLCVRD